MIIEFFIVFAFLTILYIINTENKTIGGLIYIISGVVLILLAGFRGVAVDNDYYVYRDFWRLNRLEGEVESSFYYLKFFVKNFLNLDFQILLLVYAFLGVSIKMFAIWKTSPFIWGSLLIYFSHYFILHEFTQIRIGVATGFVLLAISTLADKKYIQFLIYSALAIFFHQTCLLVLLFPIFTNKKKMLWVYTLLIPIGFILYSLNTFLNINIPIPGIQDKIDAYEEATRIGFLKDSKINPFGVLFLLRILIYYTLFIYSERIAKYFPKFYIYFKIYSLSFFAFLFFSKIPVFSFRIQELLGVVEIIILPTIVFIFNEKARWLGKVSVFGLAIILFLLDIFYNNYVL